MNKLFIIFILLMTTFGVAWAQPAPGGVNSGLNLWLKANAGTNTTTNGYSVTDWTDMSSAGFDAAADANATDYPTYTNNAINYNPALVFDGDFDDVYSDGLHLGSNHILSPSGQSVHFFIVARSNIVGYDYVNNYVFDVGHLPDYGYGLIYSNNHYKFYSPASGNNETPYIVNGAYNRPSIMHSDIDLPLGTLTLTQNGNSIYTDNIVTSTITTSTINTLNAYSNSLADADSGPFSIGRGSTKNKVEGAFSAIFNGDISELIAYVGELTATDEHKINSYLAIKYGVSLSHDYLSCDGTLIKSVGDGYAEDIAAIGRDDCSDLNQKQSISQNLDAVLSFSLGNFAGYNSLNSNTFQADKTFMIWGNDNAAASATWGTYTTAIGTDEYAITDRTWKIDVLGAINPFTGRLNVDNPQYDIPAPPADSDGIYYLIYDTDGDFSSSSISIPLQNMGGSIWEHTTSATAASIYLKIGVKRAVELCSNGVDDDGDGLIDCVDEDCTCCDAQAPILIKN